ncbi:winged helix-turn-helix transcriptional regulator [Minwuia thermotolerans]|uniref:Transcriptional regulator n=1 Tax=Minwuia thermotolerans TaxID=2056226 RepID=A0A2M9FX94_9PROT|nr:helix-turn-helix domain-containing protein [Minwuia thermotolerans]PJK28073.1 transcriptional regulator [Minwuia thermotolerans]
MALLDLLGQRWMLRILWELRRGPLTFRALRASCDDVSPTVLNGRLKSLREVGIIRLGDDGYEMTAMGEELGRQLRGLSEWAERWAEALNADGSTP